MLVFNIFEMFDICLAELNFFDPFSFFVMLSCIIQGPHFSVLIVFVNWNWKFLQNEKGIARQMFVLYTALISFTRGQTASATPMSFKFKVGGDKACLVLEDMFKIPPSKKILLLTTALLCFPA